MCSISGEYPGAQREWWFIRVLVLLRRLLVSVLAELTDSVDD